MGLERITQHIKGIRYDPGGINLPDELEKKDGIRMNLGPLP
jgi:hypothetical protein